MEGEYLYISIMSTFLLSGKRDLIVFYTKIPHPPKKYIRYVDSPEEQMEFRNNTKNPMGIYIPIITVKEVPQILNPNITDIKIVSEISNIEIIATGRLDNALRNLSVIRLDLLDFVRILLERKETLSIAFYSEVEDKKLLFSLGEPMRIGDGLYGRIYLSSCDKTPKSYVTLDFNGKIRMDNGRKEPALPYAAIIKLKEITSEFSDFLLQFL